jgi:hypothetical protein
MAGEHPDAKSAPVGIVTAPPSPRHALPLGAVRESERALLSAGATRGRRRVRQTSLPGWPGGHFLAPGSKCVFSAISGARTAPQASGSRRVLIDGGRRKDHARARARRVLAGHGQAASGACARNCRSHGSTTERCGGVRRARGIESCARGKRRRARAGGNAGESGGGSCVFRGDSGVGQGRRPRQCVVERRAGWALRANASCLCLPVYVPSAAHASGAQHVRPPSRRRGHGTHTHRACARAHPR